MAWWHGGIYIYIYGTLQITHQTSSNFLESVRSVRWMREWIDTEILTVVLYIRTYIQYVICTHVLTFN